MLLLFGIGSLMGRCREDFAAVSYTHLAVYKRQTWLCPSFEGFSYSVLHAVPDSFGQASACLLYTSRCAEAERGFLAGGKEMVKMRAEMGVMPWGKHVF